MRDPQHLTALRPPRPYGDSFTFYYNIDFAVTNKNFFSAVLAGKP
jgi:hypothetical protein